MVHGGVVHAAAPVLRRQGFDLLLELLGGVEAGVVHGAPRVGGERGGG